MLKIFDYFMLLVVLLFPKVGLDLFKFFTIGYLLLLALFFAQF